MSADDSILTLYDKDGNPVAIAKQAGGEYALLTRDDLVISLLREMIDEVRALRRQTQKNGGDLPTEETPEF